jgi:hypothetical protein
MTTGFEFDPADGDGPAGSLKLVEIRQGGAPVRLLNGWQNVDVRFQWELNPIAQALATALGGKWEVRLDVESLGEGFEGNLFTGQVAPSVATFDGTMWQYDFAKTVPDPGLEEHGGNYSGIYKIVASVWINGNPLAGTPHDMVAFDEVKVMMKEPLD